MAPSKMSYRDTATGTASQKVAAMAKRLQALAAHFEAKKGGYHTFVVMPTGSPRLPFMPDQSQLLLSLLGQAQVQQLRRCLGLHTQKQANPANVATPETTPEKKTGRKAYVSPVQLMLECGVKLAELIAAGDARVRDWELHKFTVLPTPTTTTTTATDLGKGVTNPAVSAQAAVDLKKAMNRMPNLYYCIVRDICTASSHKTRDGSCGPFLGMKSTMSCFDQLVAQVLAFKSFPPVQIALFLWLHGFMVGEDHFLRCANGVACKKCDGAPFLLTAIIDVLDSLKRPITLYLFACRIQDPDNEKAAAPRTPPPRSTRWVSLVYVCAPKEGYTSFNTTDYGKETSLKNIVVGKGDMRKTLQALHGKPSGEKANGDLTHFIVDTEKTVF